MSSSPPKALLRGGASTPPEPRRARLENSPRRSRLDGDALARGAQSEKRKEALGEWFVPQDLDDR
jgi:hypothetical protein